MERIEGGEVAGQLPYDRPIDYGAIVAPSSIDGSTEITAPSTVAFEDVSSAQPVVEHGRPVAPAVLRILPIAEQSFRLERESRRVASEKAAVLQGRAVTLLDAYEQPHLVDTAPAEHFAQAVGLHSEAKSIILPHKDLLILRPALRELGIVPDTEVAGQHFDAPRVALTYARPHDTTRWLENVNMHEQFGHGSGAYAPYDSSDPFWKHRQEHADVLPYRPHNGFQMYNVETQSWEGKVWEEGFSAWMEYEFNRASGLEPHEIADPDGTGIKYAGTQYVYTDLSIGLDALYNEDPGLLPMMIGARSDPEAMHDFVSRVDAMRPGLFGDIARISFDLAKHRKDLTAFKLEQAKNTMIAATDLGHDLLGFIANNGSGTRYVINAIDKYSRTHPELDLKWYGTRYRG